MEVNDDDLMKLIKEQFSELPVNSINAIWKMLKVLKKKIGYIWFIKLQTG